MTRRTWGLAWVLLVAGCEGAPAPAEERLVVGGRHACVLDSTAALRCFGAIDWPIPLDWVGGEGADYAVPPVDVGEPVVDAHAAGNHLCAVTRSGAIHCWGEGAGLGTDSRAPYRVGITKVEAPFRRVRTGPDRTCGVTNDGRVWCWGTGPQGQLGYDDETEVGDDEAPADIGPVPLPWPVKDVALGRASTCAIAEDGRVGCWGEWVGPAREARAVDVGGEVVQLETGGYTFCARLADGGVRCWGGAILAGDEACWPGCVVQNPGCCESGMVDPATRGDLPLGGPAIDVSLGEHHRCVVLTGGELRCWGQNGYGQLGLGHTSAMSEPTVVDVGGPAQAVAVGRESSHRTCARLVDGTVRCWGLTARWDGTTEEDCMIEVPNPNAGAICEPATIWEFACTVGEHCCLGDDEPAAAVAPVPL